MSLPGWVGRAVDVSVALARSSDASALALVGSYARGEGRPGSDVDLVLLIEDPRSLLTSTEWFAMFGADVSLVRAADFGAVQERRLLTADGHEVEVGIARPSWAAVDPVDPGTAAVVRRSMRSLHDPQGLLSQLETALRK